jgi:UDP-sulfoquinovose synthase
LRAANPVVIALMVWRRGAVLAGRAVALVSYAAAPMRILILGGDGYLGWPTALRFSARGHEVSVVDNFSRRRWVGDRGSDSLTPIASLEQRIAAWEEVSGKTIASHVGAVEDGDFLDQVVAEVRPEAVVHYGQQASAPYSMISRQHAVETQHANVIGNLNLLFAMRDHVPDAHLVKLGTMGEYGQPNIDIEEGYIEIEHRGRKDSLPFPKLPGSLYHCSKVHDSTNIHFACRTWDERLITRFDYDEVFGTVLNRFCLQAVIGHPLTVYGAGRQTRGFLNIRDTLACVELAVTNPGERGDFRVFNQFTEQFSVGELAELVKAAAEHLGYTVEIAHLENPRVEKEEHYYNAVHTKLLDLGLEPTLLGEELVESMIHTIERHKANAIESAIDPRTRWNPAKSPAAQA